MNDIERRVCVDYFRNIDRVPNLAFARALMQSLGTTTLYVRARSPAQALSPLAPEQISRVQLDVAALTGLPPEAVSILDDFPAGSISVDNLPICSRHDVTWVVPMDEKGLTTRGGGSVMVPFGNGVSALKALKLAAPLALANGLSLVFYHTTWKNPTVNDLAPAAHLCSDARRVQTLLQDEAASLGVPFEFVIECADDVADGILHTAMLKDTRLVIMPQSQMVEVGDYCYRVKDKSPIPVMIIGRKVEL